MRDTRGLMAREIEKAQATGRSGRVSEAAKNRRRDG